MHWRGRCCGKIASGLSCSSGECHFGGHLCLWIPSTCCFWMNMLNKYTVISLCSNKTHLYHQFLSHTPAATQHAPCFEHIAMSMGSFRSEDFGGKYWCFSLGITFVCAIEIIVFSDKANEFHNVNYKNGWSQWISTLVIFLDHYIKEELHFGPHEHCTLIRSNQVNIPGLWCFWWVLVLNKRSLCKWP